MEYGTYTHTAGSFNPTIITDTNGGWGMSGLAGADNAYSISGNTLTLLGGAVFLEKIQ